LFGRRRRRGVHAALADPRRYEMQIDRLHQRHLYDGGLHKLTEGEVSLATVVMHRAHVAKLLARTVERGEYEVRPATPRTILTDGKQREVLAYPLLDLVVQGVVADVLAEAIEPTLSPNLYSYSGGRSWIDGVTALARYVRRHRRERPDPRTRGLYVLRRDVESYTDSIPRGASSAIWSRIDESTEGATDSDRELIASVVRPIVLWEPTTGADVGADRGAPATRLRGVATGQPIASVCFNLYLRDVDGELDAVPGAFYGRYSDDLVFMHPDPDVVRGVSATLDNQLAALDLAFNDEKRKDLYLTAAGRVSAAWPEARGASSVTFLGMRVNADGTVALGEKKARGLLRDARRRAINTARALADADLDTRGRAVARSMTTLLDDRESELSGAAAPLLARVVTDRQQLDWVDRELAVITAAAASGGRGARALRNVPYRKVREEWRLPSVRRARDNGR
jgi:hypothetical protein